MLHGVNGYLDVGNYIIAITRGFLFRCKIHTRPNKVFIRRKSKEMYEVQRFLVIFNQIINNTYNISTIFRKILRIFSILGYLWILPVSILELCIENIAAFFQLYISYVRKKKFFYRDKIQQCFIHSALYIG